MLSGDPLSRSKEQFNETIERIKSDQSAVGIDAQYTHAVIIEYLREIIRRLDELEKRSIRGN